MTISIEKLEEKQKIVKFWVTVISVAIFLVAIMIVLWYFVFSTLGLPVWATEADIIARRTGILTVGIIYISAISGILGMLFGIFLVLRIIRSVTVEN